MNDSDNKSKISNKKTNRLVPELENVILKPELAKVGDSMCRRNEISNLITQMILSAHRRGRPRKT